jgi:hypothetical protein
MKPKHKFHRCPLAARKVFDMMEIRGKIYGEKWREMKDWELLAMVKEKVRRTETFVIDKNPNMQYENEIDTLVDEIVWSLFLLEKKLEEKE